MPFHILITEMLLRQTRTNSVAKLWEKIINDYGDPYSLSKVNESNLADKLKILGFGNQKAEALIAASNYIIQFYSGKVPKNLNKLLAIPHVGIYAARAVLCFAFNKRIEIVDVNVQRFFARYYGLEVKADVRRNPHIIAIAQQALPKGKKQSQQHNYGLLDFTAQICVARNPKCHICPLSASCVWGFSQISVSENNKG